MVQYLTKHQAIRAYDGVEVRIHGLSSALDEREWSASRPGSFIPGIIWIGG
jgi:hypothetical protein